MQTTTQLLPSGGAIQRMSPTHVIATGTLDELSSILASAERGGRLESSSDVVPAGDLFLQNLRFTPPRTTAVVPVQATVPVRRAAIQPRRESVRVTPRAKAIGITVGAMVGLGAVAGVAYEAYQVYELVARYIYVLIGGAVTALLLVGWMRSRRDCEITHIRH